ncbi:hypothetical protein L873DRAFT_1812380 [Choiromyces venosus 120613-1]|uniref:Uncharacterized protein n=1 Tax=Choiromyces venosus 120613-1 TaxID=1336337 RepID=A0A3N4JC71_9PEZI|nr:hypothetical protein L873DRAFT_1812380 [Choiromyces venosus 120613-1]
MTIIHPIDLLEMRSRMLLAILSRSWPYCLDKGSGNAPWNDTAGAKKPKGR